MSASNVASSNSSSLWQLLRGLASSSATSSATAGEDSTEFGVVSPSATAATSDGASSNDTSPLFSIELQTVLLGLQQVATSAPASGTASRAEGVSTTSTAGSALDRMFSAIDSDSSSDISAAEFTSFVKSFGGTADDANQIFALLDSDGNGSVSLADLAAALPPSPPPSPPPFTDTTRDTLPAIDRNGDGALRATELAQRLQSALQTLMAHASSDTASSNTASGISLVA